GEPISPGEGPNLHAEADLVDELAMAKRKQSGLSSFLGGGLVTEEVVGRHCVQVGGIRSKGFKSVWTFLERVHGMSQGCSLPFFGVLSVGGAGQPGRPERAHFRELHAEPRMRSRLA